MTKALILAAGLGTRLRPLTDHIPKALVEVQGKPLLQHAIEHLKRYGISEVIINLHYFPEKIKDFLRHHQNFGMEISFSDESDLLLDTGGGLKKASWYFQGNDPLFVRNVDILSNLDIADIIKEHHLSGALATLAVRSRTTSRYLLFDDHHQLCGWENRLTGEQIYRRMGEKNYQRLAFSGMQVISPGIFSLIEETGSFSLISLYLRLSASYTIKAFLDQSDLWMDAGKLNRQD